MDNGPGDSAKKVRFTGYCLPHSVMKCS
jgi:hypothetical protein